MFRIAGACLFVFVFVCFICFNLAIFFFLKQPIATLRLHGVCRGCKLQQDTNSKFVNDKAGLREAQLLKLTTPQYSRPARTNNICSHVAYLIWIICIWFPAAVYLGYSYLVRFGPYSYLGYSYSPFLFVFVCYTDEHVEHMNVKDESKYVLRDICAVSDVGIWHGGHAMY